MREKKRLKDEERKFRLMMRLNRAAERGSGEVDLHEESEENKAVHEKLLPIHHICIHSSYIMYRNLHEVSCE